MDNPYEAPGSDFDDSAHDVAGAAPYTVAQMRAAFMRFSVAYWSYIGLAVAFICVIIFTVIKFVVARDGKVDEAELKAHLENIAGFTGIGMIVMLAVAVLLMVFAMILLYRYWAVMQPYTKRTTPGKAVGFMFIPIFNIYWMFVAYHGLSKDIDRYIERHPDTKISSPSTGLILATLIIMLVSMVPYIGGLASLALIVLLFLAKLKLNNSIIGIIKERNRQHAAAQNK